MEMRTPHKNKVLSEFKRRGEKFKQILIITLYRTKKELKIKTFCI